MAEVTTVATIMPDEARELSRHGLIVKCRHKVSVPQEMLVSEASDIQTPEAIS